MNELVIGVFLFFLFLVAVMVHEVSHGWVALSLGDDTALRAGRLTFNPLRHIDGVGTILLPLLLAMIHSPFLFGWAKPVPIQVMNLRRPRRDMLWIGLAGPAANFLLAGVLAVLLRFLGPALPPGVISLAVPLAWINLVLGTFNLLPIPPLDGSRVLAGLLPARHAGALLLMERWGFLLMMVLLYFGVIQRILGPVVALLARGMGLMTR